MLLTAALESRWRALGRGAGLWVSLHRNTPLMVQLLLWYFGVAGLLPEAAMLWLNSPRSLPLPGGLALPWPSFEFLAALVGLTLYSASFICGELQAGLRGVAAGQRQAARALGMNGWQEFRWVVLPQAWRWRADR